MENSPHLTLSLLNRFLELIVSYQDYKEINDEALLELIKLIDKEEQFWHIEGKKLYKKKSWLKDLDRISRAKREQEEINSIRDIRLRIIRQLQAKLAEEFGIEPDNEQIIKIAVNILKRGKIKAALMLGVDIDNVPDMPTDFYIINYGENKVEIKL